MRFILLFFILTFPCFAYSQSDFRIDNKRNKVTIPFKFINNLIFIPVKVNGVPLTFLLDTGVEQTLLFSLDEKEEVKLFELEKLKLRGLGSKESIESYKSSKNTLQIKDYIDLNHEIYIVLDQEFNFSSHVGIPVNGIIGSNFFKNHIVEIDYDRKKICIYDHIHKSIKKRLKKQFTKDSISIENKKPYYVSTITSDNEIVPSKLLIDTGNSDAVWVFTNKTEKIKLPQKTIDDYLGKGFSGSIYGKRGRVNSFAFGTKTFDSILVTFPDSSSVKSVNFVTNRVGSIGSEIISRFTIVFDYLNKAIYTKPNHKLHLPFQFNMSGIEVEHAGLEWVKEMYEENQNDKIKIYTNNDSKNRDNSLKIRFSLKPVFNIASVRVNSEAEKSGIKVGDKILKINNSSANGYTIEMINNLLKSEEGKTIELEVERKNKTYKFKFKLKKII